MIKKALSLLLATVLFVSVLECAAVGTTPASAAPFEGYNRKFSNSKFNMYVNEETLALVIEDKATGAYMESAVSYDDGKSNKTWYSAMQSAVLLTLISSTSDDTKQADTFADKPVQKVTFTETGFVATLLWKKYELGFDLEVSLTDGGLTARVPDASIHEDGEKYKIGTISLYPYMGVSYMDTKKGYMLIPDGNGALIYLDDKEGRYNSGYSAMIYGTDIGFDESDVESLIYNRYKIVNDSEEIIAPVYGIAHTDDRIAYLAVVEDGAMRATIDVMPNGASVDYNRSYAKFIERKNYTQPTSNNSTAGSLHYTEAERSHSDLQVRFLFLSGADANYAGMAAAYREYLLGNGLIRKTGDGFTTRVDFLGTEREEWIVGTSPVVMTTVADVRDIYSDLSTRGVNKTLSVYKGWQKGGLYDIPVSKYKADRNIDGTAELTALIKDAAEDGREIYLYDDALRINPSEYNITFNTVKKINKIKFSESTHKDVYEKFNYLIPKRSEKMLTGLADSMNKQGVYGLCIAGISSQLFSWNYSGSSHTRYECADTYSQTLDRIDEANRLVLEQPRAYLWKNTDAFLDMPLYTSSYVYEDEFIPFLSMVLKGVMPVYSEYVNFEANKTEFFLKLVESGMYPSFYITEESASKLIYTNSNDIYSSEYSVYADTIGQYTKELKALNDMIGDATVSAHEILGNGITKVTYTNGVRVYVNYAETEQTADGLALPAMTYKVVKQ